jgi:predicted GNAT family acetyltransferase
MGTEEQGQIVDNPEQHCFELKAGDTVLGVIAYRADANTVTLVHTEVEDEFQGRGNGSRLVSGTLDELRGRGVKVLAACPFVQWWAEGHPEYADLVTRYREARAPTTGA